MLLEKLTADLTTAMKSRESMRVSTLRYLLAEIKKFEIDAYPPSSGKSLTEEDVVKILRRQVKSHEDSIAAFEKGNRADLVAKEQEELAILKTYLPQELSDDEIHKIVTEVKGTGITNFGQAMGMVMKQVAGRASGQRVQEILKKKLVIRHFTV